MFWIADVFIGTNSQGWNNHHAGVDADEHPRSGSRRKRRSRLLMAAAGAWTWLVRKVRAVRDRRVTKRQLERLSDHMLRDIGITRAEIGLYVRNHGLRNSRVSAPQRLRRSIEVSQELTRIVPNAASKPALKLEAPRCVDTGNDAVRRAA